MNESRFVRALTLLLILLTAGCAWQQRIALDRLYGPAKPRGRIVHAGPASGPDYWRDVKPILDSRCAVCHGCYDAPCQLNLTAFEGIDRGASKDKVYDGMRLLAARLTRLFDDAQTTQGWRNRGFYPVLNERIQTAEADLAGSVLARMLLLKHENPLPVGPRLPDSFDLGLDRNQQCPAIEEFDRFSANYPLWGMPYGLPGLNEQEHRTLIRWLELGSPYTPPTPEPPAHAHAVARWEAFLNGRSLKEQLMSRYVYEHVFLGHLYFSDLQPTRYYRMVRSRTPPGRPIDLIATRRPYDDPGVPRFYYRLQPLETTVLAKTHMPYALSPARMARYRELFLDPPFRVTRLPSYRTEIAANPFKAFVQLPVWSRFRFMLDDAEFIVSGFIKGPVCRGQVALNVINDQFWIFFTNPDDGGALNNANFLARESSNLRLPGQEASNAIPFASWLSYARLQDQFLQAKQRFMNQHLTPPEDLTLQRIWDGDGANPNAALTVFRHFDSATVVKGLVGDPPKTAWVITYALLERIHYLLVAGFDVYGNLGHQLNSRLYMDFLRMEGEFNFLILLPEEIRRRERDYWYRGASQEVKDYLFGRRINFEQQTGIAYTTRDPKAELFRKLRAHLLPVLNRSYDLEAGPSEIVDELRPLSRLQGRTVSWLPQTTFLSVTGVPGADSPAVYSLLANSAHSNISQPFAEQQRRLLDEDTLTVAHGFIGAYPNALFQLNRSELPQFRAAVAGLGSERDFQRLMDRFGIRRTDGRFWRHSDTLHRTYRQVAPIDAGLFDYNRLENR